MILIKHIDYEDIPDEETTFLDMEDNLRPIEGKKYRRYNGKDVVVGYSTQAAKAIEATINTINQKDKKIAELMLQLANMDTQINQIEIQIDNIKTLNMWGRIKFIIREIV